MAKNATVQYAEQSAGALSLSLPQPSHLPGMGMFADIAAEAFMPMSLTRAVCSTRPAAKATQSTIAKIGRASADHMVVT
jgi:hypothetical protein